MKHTLKLAMFACVLPVLPVLASRSHTLMPGLQNPLEKVAGTPIRLLPPVHILGGRAVNLGNLDLEIIANCDRVSAIRSDASKAWSAQITVPGGQEMSVSVTCYEDLQKNTRLDFARWQDTISVNSSILVEIAASDQETWRKRS